MGLVVLLCEVGRGREVRRKREKIIDHKLAETLHIAQNYSGPLTKADAQRVLDLLIRQGYRLLHSAEYNRNAGRSGPRIPRSGRAKVGTAHD